MKINDIESTFARLDDPGNAEVTIRKYQVFFVMKCASIIFHVLLFLLTWSADADEFKTELYIDPADISDTLLPVYIQDDETKLLHFEQMVVDYGQNKFAMENYFDLIFRYRDNRLLPFFYRVIDLKNIDPYFKIASIYVIGETGTGKDIERLYTLWQHETNALVREYIAGAMGKIADSTAIPLLTRMYRQEKNAYVHKTIASSIDRAAGKRRSTISYLPLIDTTRFRRLKTYPSESLQSEFNLIARRKIDVTASHFIPMAKDCIFPHMQYKMCQSIYDKVKQPFSSFALKGVSHVGEDSGWLFEGMAIHSIMNGRVALIQHEESWGCLVCIESMLADSATVCTYYGHLSHNLDVYIGKTVEKGDKIGEIGPSFTFQNGGYRSHLHIGIEKASIEHAFIAGYNDDVEHWYNPVKFIKEYGTGNGAPKMK